MNQPRRPRRLRQNAAIRAQVNETFLTPQHLIYPLFLVAIVFYHLMRQGSINLGFFADLFFFVNFIKNNQLT